MRVHHLAFRTKQVTKVVSFYRTVIGLEALRTRKSPNGKIQSVWLNAAGTIVMIELAAKREPRIPSKSLELVAFALPKAHMAAARKRLLQKRIRIEAETNFTIYFRDPDGRRVGLSTYLSPKITGPR